METELRNLLDKIYELEGLVHLAIKRDEAAPDFLRLISKKGKEVGDLALSINSKVIDNENEISKYEMADEIVSFDEYSIDDISESGDSIPHFNEDLELINESKSLKDNFSETKTVDPKERGKLVFSINERFRYRKELFDNSDIDFNNTLALVASMENYEEAEDYFLNEEEFDISNPIVLEFLDVIKRYFK